MNELPTQSHATSETPGAVRWFKRIGVIRDLDDTPIFKDFMYPILQQQWLIRHYDNGLPSSQTSEWRDVPEVTE